MSYFEIYGVPPRSAEITVRVEVAATEDGPPLAGAAAAVQNTPDEARRLAIAPIALSSLTPGDYIVRALVSVDGRPAGRVTCTLRKVRN